MNVYTVHLKGPPNDPATLERSVFVREGFSWAALIFGPLWLLWNRLWIALLVWLALEAALFVWAALASPAPSAFSALLFLLELALGFEAAQLRRAGLARRGFAMAGIAHGRRRTDAERAYFLRAGRLPDDDIETATLPAGRNRSPEMVGLFPSSGA